MTQPTRPEPADRLVDEEPVYVFLGGMATFVGVALAAASAFDWLDIGAGQTATVIGFVTAATAYVASILRARVWSPASVAAITSPPPEYP